MEKSSFFNSVNHDRVYKAEDWAGYFSSFISNGIMPLPSTGLQAVADTGMTVKLLPGKAWIDGYFYHNTDELKLPVEVADGVLDRIDRVVIRKSMTQRRMYAAIKKGTPSQKPTAPALQKDADAVELCLADILIGKGATEIKQVNITDQRLSDLCSISAGIIQQIDTAAFNAQLQAWFTEYQQASAAEYQALTAYMDSLKGQGDTDYAAFTDRMNTLEKQTHAEVQELLDSVKALLDGDAVGKIMAELSTLKESPANAIASYLDGVVAITTNPGNAKDIYFYAPSDFKESDIYTLNGQPLEIKDLNGESIYDAWKAGSPVSIIVKGSTGFFKAGGGGTADTLPPMVTNLKAAPGNGKITVSWVNPVSDVLGGVLVVYNTDRVPVRLADGMKLDAGLAGSVEITGLANGREVFIRVFPYNQKKQYQTLLDGSTASATPSEGPLQVTDLQLAGTNASPSLAWRNPEDPTYSVTVAVQTEGSPPVTPSDGKEIYRGTGHTVTAEHLKANTQYYFGVFTLSAEGGYRPPVVAGPYSYDLPQNVTDLQAAGTGSAPTIRWTAPASSPVYKETVVVQTVDHPAASLTDGVEIYRGSGTSCKAQNLERLVNYYWTVFILSTEGEYRSPVSAGPYSYNISNVLNDNEWSTISEVAKAGQGALYWKVGDTKAVDINGTITPTGENPYTFSGTYYPFVLGFNHNETLESKGIHFSFAKSALSGGKDVAFWGFKLNVESENNGGWRSCSMRTQTCSQFLSILPSALQSVIVPCTKYTDNTGGGADNGSYVTATQDKIFIPAEFEVFGKRTYANSAEQTKQKQYEYYKNGNSKIRYEAKNISSARGTWLRSVRADNIYRACEISSNGTPIGNTFIQDPRLFAPCFAL